MVARYEKDIDARADALVAALQGVAPFAGPRVDSWLARLGDRFRRAHRPLAEALASVACVDAAALRMLEAEADRFEDLVLHDPVALGRFTRIASQSSRYGRVVAANPHLAVSTRRARTRALAEIEASIAAAGEAMRDTTLIRMRSALRQRRAATMVDVLDDEITGRRAVESTASSITTLAEASIADALAFACREHGVDVETISVLGLGKLGAGELNPSSDVDLVLVALPHVVDAAGGIVRRLVDLLAIRTDEGFVFRVDLRLRPFGEAGPVVVTPDGLGEYFERHAQPWERGVWAKARTIAGGDEPGALALARSVPFVWRRSIDQSEVDELIAMKARVQARAASGQANSWDVKHGDGGIREVEFFVWSLILLAGGREPSMRVKQTPAALARLSEAGLIGEREHFALLDAWRFVRLLEHRVQFDDERQTHRVPLHGATAERLARRMGFADSASLAAGIRESTRPIRRAWTALLADARTTTSQPSLADRLVDRTRDRMSRVDEATAAGYDRAARLIGDLESLAAPPGPVLGPWASRADARRVGTLLDLCTESVAPDRAFERVRESLARATPRGTLLRVADHLPTARVLITLFAASRDVGRVLARSPEILDGLIAGYDDRSLDERLADHLEAAQSDGVDVLEQQLERLRRFRTSEQARVVLGLIGGRINVFEGTAEWTRVAERCLDVTGRLAEGPGDGRRHGVVAFGKLGAGELGYGADLDLAFVYDGHVDEIAEFAAIARRQVSYLASPMAWGRMYSVDLRLRPDGGQGTLVTPWSAFERYYVERARPWEVAALVRARPIHPDPTFSARIEAMIEKRLAAVDLGAALAELGDLRRERIAEADPDDVKGSAGGLADLELLVTAGQLISRRDGHWRGSRQGQSLGALERLVATGAIERARSAGLRDALELFRTIEQWLRIAEGDEVSTLPADSRSRLVVTRRVQRALPRIGADFGEAIRRAKALVLEALANQGWAGV